LTFDRVLNEPPRGLGPKFIGMLEDEYKSRKQNELTVTKFQVLVSMSFAQAEAEAKALERLVSNAEIADVDEIAIFRKLCEDDKDGKKNTKEEGKEMTP